MLGIILIGLGIGALLASIVSAGLGLYGFYYEKCPEKELMIRDLTVIVMVASACMVIVGYFV